VLADSGADLLACETIPSRQEAAVLLRLLRERPDRWAWLSFTCRDTVHISDGTRLADAVRLCESTPNVAAIGVNCTRPEFIAPLLEEMREATDRPLIVYPNSGEKYDATSKTWRAEPSPIDWQEAAAGWIQLGAAGIGGCCRVDPAQIAHLRLALMA
jgi:homocysteine S-methyltransferase